MAINHHDKDDQRVMQKYKKSNNYKESNDQITLLNNLVFVAMQNKTN